MQENVDLAAKEIVGEPVIAGVWIQTKPLPWFATYSNAGTVGEFFLLVAWVVFKWIFPGGRTETEVRLDHSGSIYCVQTQSELVFIAARNRLRNRQLTNVLRRMPLSELISFDVEREPASQVEIQFESGESFLFHFLGDSNALKAFGSKIVDSQTQTMVNASIHLPSRPTAKILE